MGSNLPNFGLSRSVAPLGVVTKERLSGVASQVSEVSTSRQRPCWSLASSSSARGCEQGSLVEGEHSSVRSPQRSSLPRAHWIHTHSSRTVLSAWRGGQAAVMAVAIARRTRRRIAFVWGFVSEYIGCWVVGVRAVAAEYIRYT